MATSEKSRRKSRSTKQPSNGAGLERLSSLIQSYPGTNADLGKAAQVAPSTISMIVSGTRAPSVKVIARLAKALCPPDRSLEQFTKEVLQLAGHEPTAATYSGISESIAERIQRTGKIRAAYVSTDPFVDAQGEGFAVELFKCVVALLGKRTDTTDCGISELRNVMERGRADIVVSAVLPTFQRRSYMWFSKPFPYLRVPLSALVRKGTSIRPGQELTVDHVLNWSTGVDGLGRVKIVLVDGEVGHDFVTTFLRKVKDFELLKTLVSSEISAKLAVEPAQDLLFVADMATCVAVNKRLEGFQPLPDPSPIGHFFQDLLKHDHDKFPVLALYPITFGLPKGDEDWQKTIDRALDYLMSEGARVLLSLYERYLERDKFLDFCIADDELIESKPLRQMFEGLFKKAKDPTAEVTLPKEAL